MSPAPCKERPRSNKLPGFWNDRSHALKIYAERGIATSYVFPALPSWDRLTGRPHYITDSAPEERSPRAWEC